jgi:hypothetical protein
LTELLSVVWTNNEMRNSKELFYKVAA